MSRNGNAAVGVMRARRVTVCRRRCTSGRRGPPVAEAADARASPRSEGSPALDRRGGEPRQHRGLVCPGIHPVAGVLGLPAQRAPEIRLHGGKDLVDNRGVKGRPFGGSVHSAAPGRPDGRRARPCAVRRSSDRRPGHGTKRRSGGRTCTRCRVRAEPVPPSLTRKNGAVQIFTFTTAQIPSPRT